MRQPFRTPKRASAHGPLALVLVDGTQIRQKIKREYQKALRDLEKARTELDRFEKEDAPAFKCWVNSHFGALLTEMRETDRRISELRRLFLEIETEILFTGASPGRAYARVMEDRNNPKNPDESTEEDEDDPFSGGRTNKNGRSSHSEEDFADADPDFAEFFGFGRNKAARPARPPSSTVMGRIKELYRALARRLHPDARRHVTAQQQEWWHQAQAAYEQNDVEQLEVILSLCEIEETGTTEKTSLSVLQRISAQLKKTLRQLRSQLAGHRRDPAWNFKGRTDLEALGAVTRNELTYDLGLMKAQLQAMELEMASWAKQAQRRRPQRPRRRPMTNPFEFFR